MFLSPLSGCGPVVGSRRVLRQFHHAHGAAVSSGRLRQLPEEDKNLAVLRTANLTRGLYIFPFCTHKE